MPLTNFPNGVTVDGITTIDENGFVLNDTVWEDLRETLSGKNLTSVPGKADYDFDNLWIILEESGSISTAGDVVGANFQLSHATKANSTGHIHLHWIQTTETSRTITGKYRIQNNGTTPTTSWTDFTATCTKAADNVFPWAVGGLVQITKLVEVDLTGVGVSAILQVKIARTDANASNDMYALYMDMHFEIDTIGSQTEFVK